MYKTGPLIQVEGLYKYTVSREAKKMAPRSKAKRRFAPLRAADRKAEIYSHFPALFELAKKMKFALNFQPCLRGPLFDVRAAGRPAGRPGGCSNANSTPIRKICRAPLRGANYEIPLIYHH